MLKLTLRFLPEREVNKEVFSLLINTLDAVSASARGGRLSREENGVKPFSLEVLFYKIRFLEISGYAPPPEIPSQGRGLYESLRKWDASKLARIRPHAGLVKELSAMLDAHIEYMLSL